MKDKQKMNFRAAGGRKYSIHARSTHTKYLVGLLVVVAMEVLPATFSTPPDSRIPKVC